VLFLRDVHADVALADDVARVRARATAGKAKVEASLDLPLRTPAGRRVTGRVDAVEAPWVVAIAGALGAGDALKLEGDAPHSPGTFFLPRDARANAGVTYEHDGETPRATLTVRAETSRSALALEPVAIERSRITGGRLHGSLAIAEALAVGLFPSDVRPRGEGEILVDAAIEGPLEAPVLRGRLASPRILLEIASRPEAPPFPCLDVDARAVATKESLRFDEIRFRAFGGTCRLVATFAKTSAEDLLVLRVKDADATLIEAIAGLAGGRPRLRAEREGPRPSDEIWIARGLLLSGRVRLARDLALRVDATLESARGTALAAALVIGEGGGLDGSRVHGPVAIADALVLADLGGAVAPLPEGALHLDATLEGRGSAVSVSGVIEADRLALAVGGDGRAPVVVSSAVSVPFHADAKRFVWRNASARLYEGVVASTGAVGFAGRFVGTRAVVAVRDVVADSVPTDRRGGLLGDAVRGRLSADLHIERAGEGPVIGRGHARLDAPSYPVLALASSALRRYGLPAPDPRGAAPATTTIALDASGWAFRDVFAAVPGCAALGDLLVRKDGSVDGAFVVTLDEEYLATSALLVIPGVLAETLTMPVRITGPLANPVVDADLGTLLGRFVTENRVTDLVTDAAEGVVSLFTGREPKEPPARGAPKGAPPAPAPLPEDPILAGIVARAADWDAIERRKRAR
jgi:hypothetical protein